MVYSRLLTYLESDVFFPVLRASPEDFRGRKQKLFLLQCEVIDVLRDRFYTEALSQNVLRMLTVTLHTSEFALLWASMEELGFRTPLHPDVCAEMLRCACLDEGENLVSLSSLGRESRAAAF